MSILRTHSGNRQLSTVKGFYITATRFAAIVLAAWMIVSCGSDKKPDDVLTREQMANVLIDLYITEEKVSRLRLRTDSATRVMRYFENTILSQADVSDTVWRRSYNWYAHRPQELQAVYAIVIDSLHLREQRTDMVPPPPGSR